MKKTIKIIIVSLLFINCKAQTVVPLNTRNTGDNTGKYFKDINNVYSNFTGTWENTTGNITFRVILWRITKDPIGYPTKYHMDMIGGSFMIIQNAGDINEVVLHNSVKYFHQSNTTSNRVVWGISDNTRLDGHFEDTCASGETEILPGFFSLIRTNPGVTPAIAHWKIKSRSLLVGSYYSIPTDIMLTKVN